MKKLNKVLGIAMSIFLMASCSSDDDINSTPPPSLISEQLEGNWIVSYFWDQSVRTNEFGGYTFIFDSNSKIEVDVDQFLLTNSSYDIYLNEIDNQQYTILDFHFGKGPNSIIDSTLRELTEDWIVKRISSDGNVLELEELYSDNQPEILHLTKITSS